MLKPFGLSIFFYRTKTILSTKNIRKYTHEYATSISQNTHICCAKYSHSTTKYIATNLQQHNIQKTKTILLQCKNPLFARQKGGFYTPKNPFLFFVSITNTLLMCYEYSVKWLRTPTKCATKHTPMAANGLPIIQYMCVIMRCLWDIKIGEAQNTFVFLHFSTTHFIRRYLGNCATIWCVACPKKVRCLC